MKPTNFQCLQPKDVVLVDRGFNVEDGQSSTFQLSHETSHSLLPWMLNPEAYRERDFQGYQETPNFCLY